VFASMPGLRCIGRTTGAVLALVALALLASPGVPARAADASLQLDARHGGSGGVIPSHFVGFSIEWSLIERYMGDSARPAFANLLRNLGTGELRIGGSSQDLMPFDPAAPNTVRVITPEDLQAVRTTLEAANARDDGRAVPSWGAILGTTLAPPDAERPWAGPEHARRFVTDGVLPVFGRGAERTVAGIGLGNEPDISYRYDLARYLQDLTAYRDAAVTDPFPIVAPSTSETIAPWQAIDAREVPTRFFWDWPAILDVIAPEMKARRGAYGALATDHFYPLARGCETDAYRCATIERLLSDERLANLAYNVYSHAVEANRRGLVYRLQETNTAAGRGVAGVSNVAASALWALAMMFESACPQPPNAPGANAGCATGAGGINLHNAEVERFFFPEEGNAFYNAIAYDPSPAAGAPAAAPPYYALLLFSRFAQETHGLRPVSIAPDGTPIRAWQVQARGGDRRLFAVNMSGDPQAVTVAAGNWRYMLSRMTPYDPTGAGRTLDAPQVRIDGRAVAADGSWPGFAPTTGRIQRGRLRLTLGAGEAAVVTLRGH
jgi:hypothetical protein